MEECLRYFRRAIQRPDSVVSWADWWRDHQAAVLKHFDRIDYLRLKFRKLEAAREVLHRLGRPAAPISPDSLLLRTHCEVCDERLIHFVPDVEVSQEEVVAFGERADIEQCRQGYMLHPGVYCANRCTWAMMEFDLSQW